MKNSALARWILDNMMVVWPRLSEKSGMPVAERIASRFAYSDLDLDRGMPRDIVEGNMTFRQFNRKYHLDLGEATMAEADPVFACGETSR